MRKWSGLVVPFLSLLTAACNITTPGDRGIVHFTPNDCGELICTLGADLAAGTSVAVSMATSSLTLGSDDPTIAMVVPLPFNEYQVIGVGAGRVHLVALDHGHELDRTSLDVVEPARYGLVSMSGSAFRGTPEQPGEEIWVVPASGSVHFHVRPFNAFGSELMGKMNLQTELDEDLFASLTATASLPEGELSFSAMGPGTHWMSVSAHGIALDVLFDAR